MKKINIKTEEFLKSEFFELPETKIGYVKPDEYIVINLNKYKQFLVGFTDVKTQQNGKISLRIKLERNDRKPKEYKLSEKIDNNYKNDKQYIIKANDLVKELKQNGFKISKFNIKDLLAKAGEK